MFALKISFEFIPHLALTIGPFPDRQAVKERLMLLARYWIANDWRQVPLSEGTASDGDGALAVCLESAWFRQKMTIRSVIFEAPPADNDIIDMLREVQKLVFDHCQYG